MRVGFSMLCFSGSTERQHLPLLERIAELGYDGVEVPVVGADPGWLEALARRLDELGLARTAVGFATAECDPISDDPAVRRAADEHLAGLVERSAILGADYLGGPIHSGYAVFGKGPATEEQLGRSAEALHRMAEVAGQHGNLRLGVEFLNRFECFLVTTAAETDALVERAEHPAQPRCVIAAHRIAERRCLIAEGHGPHLGCLGYPGQEPVHHSLGARPFRPGLFLRGGHVLAPDYVDQELVGHRRACVHQQPDAIRI